MQWIIINTYLSIVQANSLYSWLIQSFFFLMICFPFVYLIILKIDQSWNCGQWLRISSLVLHPYSLFNFLNFLLINLFACFFIPVQLLLITFICIMYSRYSITLSIEFVPLFFYFILPVIFSILFDTSSPYF